MLYYTRSAQKVNIKSLNYRNIGKIVTLSTVPLCGIPKPIALEIKNGKKERRIKGQSSKKDGSSQNKKAKALRSETTAELLRAVQELCVRKRIRHGARQQGIRDKFRAWEAPDTQAQEAFWGGVRPPSQLPSPSRPSSH